MFMIKMSNARCVNVIIESTGEKQVNEGECYAKLHSKFVTCLV